MQKVTTVICWLAVVVLGVLVGMRWMLTPEIVGAEFGIAIEGAQGLNQMRGDMGGVFVGLGVIGALGLVRKEPNFLRAVAIAVGGVILGRMTGLVMDGVIVESLIPILVESTLVASLVITANGMGDAAGQEASSDS